MHGLISSFSNWDILDFEVLVDYLLLDVILLVKLFFNEEVCDLLNELIAEFDYGIMSSTGRNVNLS